VLRACRARNPKGEKTVSEKTRAEDERLRRELEQADPEKFERLVSRGEYYFVRETGEFDGTATLELNGPLMVYDRGAE
jgi:hypothetical protein